jgi:hypothetical protein
VKPVVALLVLVAAEPARAASLCPAATIQVVETAPPT